MLVQNTCMWPVTFSHNFTHTIKFVSHYNKAIIFAKLVYVQRELKTAQRRRKKLK